MSLHSAPYQPVVLTIGHRNRSLETFLDLVRAQRPRARRGCPDDPARGPQCAFNRDTLPLSLRRTGIGYIHIRGLGGTVAGAARFFEHGLAQCILPEGCRLYANL